MKHISKFIALWALVILYGCTDDSLVGQSQSETADPQELQGIHAIIDESDGITRAGTVTPLADYVGRSKFKKDDEVVFTTIKRTANPFAAYTYPGSGSYEGIKFQAGTGGVWDRITDGGPDRIYWTDARSPHTFIAYGIPQGYGDKWKRYTGAGTPYYIGALGDPMNTAATDIIDYSLTTEEQEAANTTDDKGNVVAYGNSKLEKEDVVIAYNTEQQADPGGSVATVKFKHALSSVRVVVNISGFSSTDADNAAVVSDLRLLHQPTMYVWMQGNAEAQPLRATKNNEGTVVTDQPMVDSAWGGTGPAYDQRKDMKLWIPNPAGVGDNQSRTFTFYGITTPQDESYISTLPSGEEPHSEWRNAEITFKVTYPDPLKPTSTVTNNYHATISQIETTEGGETTIKHVYFKAGYNTTINITLNHRDEKMTLGAEYENWQFVATPDQGNLHKHATFLANTERTTVEGKKVITIADDSEATEDDATWLYKSGSKVLDIYGHEGDSESDAYQISTADQLLSFAYEVKSGRDFSDKYVRLDADLTLQKSSDLVKEEFVITQDNSETFNNAESGISWLGIGDATHPFNGKFLGGNRYIYRLKGSPLFSSLGTDAVIEGLNVSAIVIGNSETGTPSSAVTGGGLFADTNAGLICACRVDGDVSLSGTTAGAFVGTNSGQIFASYHIGNTKGTTHVGGLVGSNIGIISSCYQAGTVTGGSSQNGGITPTNTDGTLDNNYYLASTSDATTLGATAKTAADMTKQAFVNNLNDGIALWREGDETHSPHTGYDNHSYVYQPASYPKLK